jgi:pyruvate formate lyase activating enzyme
VTLCDKLKNLGFPIKVDTNGSRPKVIRNLIKQGLVDYVAMDIKTAPFDYATLASSGFDPKSIQESIRIIMESGIDYEFRTTCIKPLVDENVVRNISELIEGSMLYALQRFRGNKVLKPEFFRCGGGGGSGLSETEISRLRAIASSFVQSCIVR